MNFTKFVTLFGATAALAACSGNSKDVAADVKFASAHSIALDGVANNAIIFADTDNDNQLKSLITSQLQFTMGQLNGNNGVADLNKTQISIQTKEKISDTLFKVTYAAKLFVSWPKERSFPASYTLYMPAKGDYSFLNSFYETFSTSCISADTHGLSMGNHWYYYRPMVSGCTIPTLDEKTIAKFELALTRSDENTTGKYPEYNKVWEDNQVVTMSIFGMADDASPSEWDEGVRAYKSTVSDILAKYGKPTFSNLSADQQPSIENPYSHLEFDIAGGKLIAHLYLVKGIRNVDSNFMTTYNEVTKTADFVAYSGHSGLGANIRALSRMGTFVKGQYQLFLVNGCDTFAYVEDSLRNAHATANPDGGADKYFDIITNAMPSYFSKNAVSNMAIINALVGRTLTYEQILAGFDKWQRAAVTGEQDNAFPNPF